MDWLGAIFKVILPIIQPIVHIVEQVVQTIFGGSQATGASSGGQHNTSSPSASAGPSPEDLKHAQEQRHLHTLHQQAEEFDRDFERSKPSDALPLAQRIAKDLGAQPQDYLAPIAVDVLNLLVHPDAKRVSHLLKHIPQLVEAALSIHPTSREAINWMLAKPVDLSSEQLDGLIAQYRTGLLTPSSAVLFPSPWPLQGGNPQTQQLQTNQLFGPHVRGQKENASLSEALDNANAAFERFAIVDPARASILKSQLLKQNAINPDGTIDLNALKKNMEDVFGYQIQFDHVANQATTATGLPRKFKDFNVEEDKDHPTGSTGRKYTTLQLLSASLQISAYLGSVTTSNEPGYVVFRQYFSSTDPQAQAFAQKEGKQLADKVTIHLGAEDNNAGYDTGYTGATSLPIVGRTPHQPSSIEDWNQIYLGSEMTVAGIVHEFGHQLDRRFIDEKGAPLFSSPDAQGLNAFLKSSTRNEIQLTYTDSIVQGRAGRFAPTDSGEQVADIFMTAVLSGEKMYVYQAPNDSIAWGTRGVMIGSQRTSFGAETKQLYAAYLQSLLIGK